MAEFLDHRHVHAHWHGMLEVAAECLKAAIIAKKLQTKTALEAIGRMAERFKEEDRNGRTAGRN
jgi:hypothetical protein